MPEPTISIYRRHRSRWWWYSLHSNGTRLRGSCMTMGCAVDTHTEQQAREAVAEHFAKGTGEPEYSTLGWLHKNLESFLANQSVRDTTIEKYGQALKPLMELFGKYTPVADIKKRPHVEQFKLHLLDKDITPQTVNSKLRMCRAIFQRLYDGGHIEENPFTRFKKVREFQNMDSVFTPEELVKLFSTMRRARSRDNLKLCLILLFTGRRVSEILNLAREDIDLKGGRFAPMNVKHRDRRKWWLEIPPRAKKYIAYFMNKNKRSDQPFRVARVDTLSHWFKFWRKEAGLPAGKHLHSLRHTFVTLALEANESPWAVKEYLDHSTIQLTESYFRFIQPAKKSVNFSVTQK